MSKKTKGEYKGLCNRTACQSPNNVIYFNHSTEAYYCPACAALINEMNYADSMRMFGHELCTTKHPDNRNRKPISGLGWYGGVKIRE